MDSRCLLEAGLATFDKPNSKGMRCPNSSASRAVRPPYLRGQPRLYAATREIEELPRGGRSSGRFFARGLLRYITPRESLLDCPSESLFGCLIFGIHLFLL